MENEGLAKRLVEGARHCVGLGLLAGAMESVHLATSSKLPMSWLQFMMLGLSDMALMGIVGGLFGLLAGAVHLLGARRDGATMIAWQIALCTLLLTGYFLWQGAWWTATDGAQPIGGAAMAAMPIGFAGVAFFNARFLLRRSERHPSTVPWLAVAGFAGVVLVGIASGLAGSRDTGGSYALDGDDNLLIVTVDGLRHDQVGDATPTLAGFADVRFVNAVTPSPDARSANTTVLTGLHPLRHRVLSHEQRLGRAYRPIFEILAAEGWATGAFVSSSQVSVASGLDQGFLTYDDDFGGVLTGLSRINIVGHVTRWFGTAAGARAGSATVSRFEGWLDRHMDRPWAAWVHLSDPEQATGSDGGIEASLGAVDGAVQRMLDAVEGARATDSTMVVVVGTHGMLLGAHGGQGNATLYDDVVRVPFLVRAPGTEVREASIDAQVRLMDVANTALEWLELDRMDASEGIALLEYAKGTRTKTIWCPLVGRDVDGDWLIGLRNNGVKYVRHPDGREELYDVGADPGELKDLSSEQTSILQRARSLLGTDSVAFRALVGD